MSAINRLDSGINGSSQIPKEMDRVSQIAIEITSQATSSASAPVRELRICVYDPFFRVQQDFLRLIDPLETLLLNLLAAHGSHDVQGVKTAVEEMRNIVRQFCKSDNRSFKRLLFSNLISTYLANDITGKDSILEEIPCTVSKGAQQELLSEIVAQFNPQEKSISKLLKEVQEHYSKKSRDLDAYYEGSAAEKEKLQKVLWSSQEKYVTAFSKLMDHLFTKATWNEKQEAALNAMIGDHLDAERENVLVHSLSEMNIASRLKNFSSEAWIAKMVTSWPGQQLIKLKLRSKLSESHLDAPLQEQLMSIANKLIPILAQPLYHGLAKKEHPFHKQLIQLFEPFEALPENLSLDTILELTQLLEVLSEAVKSSDKSPVGRFLGKLFHQRFIGV